MATVWGVGFEEHPAAVVRAAIPMTVQILQERDEACALKNISMAPELDGNEVGSRPADGSQNQWQAKAGLADRALLANLR